MSVAAKIADNLIFADDVSDEDVKHKPILAEYIETESGKKSNSPQLGQRIFLVGKLSFKRIA